MLTPPPVSIDQTLGPILDRALTSPVLPRATHARLDALLPPSLPREGAPIEEVLGEIDAVAVDYSRRNAHPGFFGYVCSSGLPTDPLGHALVAALNQNVTGFGSAPGATTIERRVIRWLADLAGLPAEAGGLFQSGGSLANFTALAVALHHGAKADLRRKGVAAAGPVAVYVSGETHFSVERAAVLLGLGLDAVRQVPCDTERRMRPDRLAGLLAADRSACRIVVATAGTTTTGAIDPLREIAALCRRHGAWLHVDAAYGGAVLMCDALRARLDGIESADSVTIDLHKWFFTGFDASVLLLRDPDLAREVFFAQTDYVQLPREGGPEGFAFFHLSLETSRRFRALPVYLALRHYGADALGEAVRANIRCAEHLAALVEAHDELEPVAAPRLSIVCFRHRTADNEAIRRRLVAEGDFHLSATSLSGAPVLRVCVQTPATAPEHMEALVEAVLRIGRDATG